MEKSSDSALLPSPLLSLLGTVDGPSAKMPSIYSERAFLARSHKRSQRFVGYSQLIQAESEPRIFHICWLDIADMILCQGTKMHRGHWDLFSEERSEIQYAVSDPIFLPFVRCRSLFLPLSWRLLNIPPFHFHPIFILRPAPPSLSPVSRIDLS